MKFVIYPFVHNHVVAIVKLLGYVDLMWLLL